MSTAVRSIKTLTAAALLLALVFVNCGGDGGGDKGTGTPDSYSFTTDVSPAGGGTVIPSPSGPSYETGEAVKLTAVPNAGYEFAQWLGDASGTANPVTVTVKRDMTATALFEPVTYKVTFNANGGTGAPPAQTKSHGDTLKLSGGLPERNGYTFTSWNTQTDGGGTDYVMGADYAANAAVTLYAQWTPSVYEVTYNANGGTDAPDAQEKTHGAALTLSDAPPVRAGYTFTGWNTQAYGNGTAYAAGGNYTADSALTLYAQWKQNIYEITYNANGGSGAPDAQTKSHGLGVNLSVTLPVKTGYTFTGWNTEEDGEGTAYDAGGRYAADTSVTLYAQWTITTYAVTYYANGGSDAPDAQEKTHGVTLKLSGDLPSRSGYTFIGWNTLSGGGGASYDAGADYAADAAVTLYAQWAQQTYAVTYNANGGTDALVEQVKVHGVALTLRSAPTARTGYTFASWNTLADGSGTAYNAGGRYAADSALALYAQWTPKSYAVTYNANGGTDAPAAQTKTHDITLKLSGDLPEKNGYTFTNWNTLADGSGTAYSAGGNYTADTAVALYAQWALNTYAVTYNANGGTNAPSAQTKTHDAALTLSAAQPVKAGYAFTGWNALEDGEGTAYGAGAEYADNAAITLYAQWAATYTVTYNANGGTGAPPAQTKVHGVTLTLSETPPVKTGYMLTGWNTQEDGSGTAYAEGADYTANAALTLYAQWTVAVYAVTYNALGGTGTPSAQSKTHDVKLTLSDAPPVKTGYTFANWNSQEAGGGTSYAPGADYTVNAEVTLYAQWTPHTYIVTYNANGGTGGPAEAQTKTHAVALTLSDSKPTRANYVFSSWNTEEGGGGTSYASGGSYTANAAVTLYAQWASTYTVTYNANGGAGAPAAQTKVHGVTLGLSADKPTQAGKVFSGWNTSAAGGGTAYASGANYTGNADVTLYAQWAEGYTITYNANNGTGAPAAQAKTHGITLTLTGAIPTRSGYVFVSWNTASAGTGTRYFPGASYITNADMTLYAQWTPGFTLGGQIYKTVKIGNQTWMAENLNYATASGSACYNGTTANCDKYGRLYDWATAMALPASYNSNTATSQIQTKHKGICATGWHIPTDAEWTTLVNYVESDKGSSSAARHLKAEAGWSSCGPTGSGSSYVCDDTYDFAALPGGYGSSSSSFSSVGSNGYWWSATEYGASYADYRIMGNSGSNVGRGNYSKSSLYSVRCVQD